MIYYVISASPKDGKEAAATKWMLKMAKHFRENYGKYGQYEIASSMSGAAKMHWIHKCPSLTAFDECTKAWRADKKNPALSREGQGLLGPGETHFHEVLEG